MALYYKSVDFSQPDISHLIQNTDFILRTITEEGTSNGLRLLLIPSSKIYAFNNRRAQDSIERNAKISGLEKNTNVDNINQELSFKMILNEAIH